MMVKEKGWPKEKKEEKDPREIEGQGERDPDCERLTEKKEKKTGTE